MPASVRADDDSAPGTLERVLAMAAATLVGIALVGFIVTLAQLALRASWPWLDEGIWPYAFLLPAFALPAGFLCVLALLITSMVRKSRR